MPNPEWMPLGLMVAGLVLGCCAVCWKRARRPFHHAFFGFSLFAVTLLILSVGTLLAAVYCPEYLMASGLTSGWVVVALLWEGPAAAPATHVLLEEPR